MIHVTPVSRAITGWLSEKLVKMDTKFYILLDFIFLREPLKNWFFFYPAEYILSALTDGIVAINSEDFRYINGKMLHKESFIIKGIGIDTGKFRAYNIEEIEITRKELSYLPEHFILLYIAGFNYNKNHHFIINAVPKLKKEIPELKVIFAGKGKLLNEMLLLSTKNNLTDTIDFIGFRYDIEKFAAIADIGISASRREGFDMGISEEMICSIPVVASFNRGHKEIIDHGYNGFMYTQGDAQAFINYILRLHDNPLLRKTMGENSFKKAQEFTIEESLQTMSNIYKRYLN